LKTDKIDNDVAGKVGKSIEKPKPHWVESVFQGFCGFFQLLTMTASGRNK
jgi:hypothetical protein